MDVCNDRTIVLIDCDFEAIVEAINILYRSYLFIKKTISTLPRHSPAKK